MGPQCCCALPRPRPRGHRGKGLSQVHPPQRGRGRHCRRPCRAVWRSRRPGRRSAPARAASLAGGHGRRRGQGRLAVVPRQQ
eukprot:1724485-Lingulodinium_polyedra.AAC.1